MRGNLVEEAILGLKNISPNLNLPFIPLDVDGISGDLCMQPVQNSISYVNHCRQIAQQLIQQTQQSNQQYQQMLQNEQQNIQILDQVMQKERMSVQVIQQSLRGHEMAMQRCQEVINECNRLEQEISGQMTTGFQQGMMGNTAFQSPMYQSGYQNQYRQQ